MFFLRDSGKKEYCNELEFHIILKCSINCFRGKFSQVAYILSILCLRQTTDIYYRF